MKNNKNKDEKQFLIESSDNNIKTVNKNKSKTIMNKNKTVDKSKTTMNKNKTMDKSKNVNKNQTIDKSKNMNKSQTIDKSKTVDNSKSKNIITNNEISFSSTEEFDKKLWDCYDKIDLARHDDLLRMIEAIRYKINDLTEGTFVNDFIYHFIINQYSLNTLNSDMYNNTIQSNEFDEIDLRNLVVLLGGVLYDLLSYIDISLYDLLEYSAYRLNKIQGIRNLNCNKKESLKLNSDFAEFCKKHYISFGKGWEFIRCRNKIFDLDVKNYGIVSEIENCLKGICYAMMI